MFVNVGGECVRDVRRELTDHGNMSERYVGGGCSVADLAGRERELRGRRWLNWTVRHGRWRRCM